MVAVNKLTSSMFTRHSALTGSIAIPPGSEIDLTQEPIFAKMLVQWGYPPVGVPWTGNQICEGRVLDADEPIVVEEVDA